MTSQFNLSLDQHALPGRSVPTTAGGFLSYPSKIRSLREPPAADTTKLILDLGLPRGQSAGEGRRVRESLEEMSDIKAASSSVLLDPTSSQVVQHFRQKAVKRSNLAAPSLIGGSGFSESLTRRNLDSLSYARMRRNEVDTQTAPAFAKLDLSDLSAYQKWSKATCDPFLKELRQAILSNRPEDIGEFTLAWTLAYVKGQPPPQAWLPGEEESTKLMLEKQKLAESEEADTPEAKDP